MPPRKDSFQLQCDIPLKIKDFFKSNAKAQRCSVSSILYSNFKSYLDDNGNWPLPQNIISMYDGYGEIGFNNLKFLVDKPYRNYVESLTKLRFTDYKGITKHFVYSLYYKLESKSCI
jgi:hypothetical protein